MESDAASWDSGSRVARRAGPWSGAVASVPAGDRRIRSGGTISADIRPGVTDPGDEWLRPGFLTLGAGQRHKSRRTSPSSRLRDAEARSASHIPGNGPVVRDL